MRKYVMIIDDDEQSLLIGDLHVRKSGFAEHVIQMQDGESALDYFEQQTKLEPAAQNLPDIIFLDLNMPYMDGWEFLKEFGKRFQKKFPQCHIFILTSSTDPDEVERASFEPLIMGFIVKPLNEKNLAKLAKSRILQEQFQIKVDPKK